METIKINHEEKLLIDALCLTPEEGAAFVKLCAECSRTYTQSNKQSEVAELLQNNASFKALLLAASLYVCEKTEQMLLTAPADIKLMAKMLRDIDELETLIKSGEKPN